MTRLAEADAELIRRHLGREVTPGQHAQMRARLLEATTEPRPGRSKVRGALAFSFAAALACVVWLVVGLRPVTPVTFTVGASELPGSVGRYYAAVAPGNLDFAFSDGSRISVEPGGGARVAEARPIGATVVLERGVAWVQVEPRRTARWLLVAGPYTVEVTGTAFRMSWDPSASRLGVEMEHGSVILTGPGMEQGVRLSGTESFVSESSIRLEPSSARAGSVGTSASAAEADAATAAPTAGPMEPAPAAAPAVKPNGTPPAPAVSSAPPPAPPAAPTWRQLVARGDYQAVLAEADAKGLDVVLQSGSAAELEALSDAARYAGRIAAAERVLRTMRERFPGTASAREAAFLLGRLADESGNASAALGWYERYLQEAPADSLTAEALGRKMQVLQRTGQTEQARSIAERYLERFPEGAYASYATKLLSP
jgi:TolA-binding protein